MLRNVGRADRALRIFIGVAMLLAPVLIENPLAWLGLAGFVPLLTGIGGNCPLYSLLHINTCSSQQRGAQP